MGEFILHTGIIPKVIPVLSNYFRHGARSFVDSVPSRIAWMFSWRMLSKRVKPSTRDSLSLDLPEISKTGSDKNNLRDQFGNKA